MLKKLREHTKTFLWIVVIAFVVSIFAIWGMNLKGPSSKYQDTSILGSVNGVEITRQSYLNTLNQLYAQLRQSRGEDYQPTPQERRLIEEQAWQNIIQRILLDDEIKRLNITVSDEELVTFLRTNPHPSLKKVFKDENGNFDYQAYLQALADPSMDWTELERWGRAVLPESKLQLYLAAQIHIPEKEIMDRFRETNIEMKAKYIKVPLKEEDPPYEPTEEEISNFYKEHMEDFNVPEQRKVALIKIEKKPTEADEQDVRERAYEIRDEILKGRDFADAAKEYSDDDVTAPNGGDLGFFKKGDMVNEFGEAAFSLKPGEVSKPVRTTYGYHLIKVEEKKFEDGAEKVHARHILLKVEPGYETIDSLSTLIKNLTESIRKKGFEKAAAEAHLDIITPEPFAEGSFIKGLGYLPQIVDFAFNHTPGKVSSPIETEEAVYFVKVADRIPEHVKPLEEVKVAVVDRIRRKRMEETARKIAEEIRLDILSGQSFESAAAKRNLEVKETPMFKLHSNIPDIGTNTAFARACYLLPPNRVSPPIEEPNAFYIIKVLEKSDPDMDLYTKQRDDIMMQLQSEKSSRFIASWYDQIRKRAKIVDLRERTLN